jgi:hypothetical protein
MFGMIQKQKQILNPIHLKDYTAWNLELSFGFAKLKYVVKINKTPILPRK